eukprot:9782621-Lingulodinium_polyedra.AAC.1
MDPVANGALPLPVQPSCVAPVFCSHCQIWLSSGTQWISHTNCRKHRLRCRLDSPRRHARAGVPSSTVGS